MAMSQRLRRSMERKKRKRDEEEEDQEGQGGVSQVGTAPQEQVIVDAQVRGRRKCLVLQVARQRLGESFIRETLQR